MSMMSIAVIWLVTGAVLGMIAGSFLSTLILRWPQGASVMRGRSRCDHCGTLVRMRDMIPLISIALLRGRCRTCKARVDPLHVRFELLCAVLGGLAFWFHAGDWSAAAGWAMLLWILATLVLLDARHFWLPDALTLPLIAGGMVLGPAATGVSRMESVAGALAGFGALALLAMSYRALRKRDGLGMGDAKLLAALGSWFGWQALPFILLMASLSALLWAGFQAWRGGEVKSDTAIPLGVFLGLGAVPGWMLSVMMMMMLNG